MANTAVIINADDLGISQEVNEAVFDLAAKGRISSATIMANAPATLAAVRRVSTFPKCSFGVHLNLTQFEPLTAGPGARLLVDECGQMSRANARLRPRPDRLRAVYQELCAQIERAVALGVRVSHLDSHHHVHTRPVLFCVLKEVQRRYGIRKIRLAKNFYSAEQPCRPDLLVQKRAYNWALRSLYTTHTTDAFTEFLTYYHADDLRKRSIGRIELMLHPGAPYAAEETAILESDWLARTDGAVQVISYAELSPARHSATRRAVTSRDLLPCG